MCYRGHCTDREMNPEEIEVNGRSSLIGHGIFSFAVAIYTTRQSGTPAILRGDCLLTVPAASTRIIGIAIRSRVK